jgi:small nuclear ribonucleoprotein
MLKCVYRRFLCEVKMNKENEVGSRLTLSQPKKPLQILQKSINRLVCVRLKSELEYRGRMNSIDPYMNVILLDATEYTSGSPSANYGKVVIRGNNVLFIKIEEEL